MNKRVKANLYTLEDIKWFPKEHTHKYTRLDNNYLYAHYKNGTYNTKLTSKDLPPWYTYGRFYKRWGYLNTKGIKYIKYKPMKINHSLKDDCIMISYGEPIISTKSILDFEWYNCDETVWGSEIINVLVYAEKYSNYDISGIIEQIWGKMERLKEYGIDCYNSEVKSRENFDKWFESARERRDKNE